MNKLTNDTSVVDVNNKSSEKSSLALTCEKSNYLVRFINSINLLQERSDIVNSELDLEAIEFSVLTYATAMAAEYAIIMEENKPELTQDQWNALYCVYNGYAPSEDPQREARSLPWRIREGYQYDVQVRDSLGSKEQAIGFIEEVNGWSITTQLSAIYFAKAFWSNSSNSYLS